MINQMTAKIVIPDDSDQSKGASRPRLIPALGSCLIPRFMLVPESVDWLSPHINPQVLPCLALLQTASQITYLSASRKSRVVHGHRFRLERGSQLAKEKIIIINLFIIYVDHLNTKCTSNCLIFQVLSFPAPRLS